MNYTTPILFALGMFGILLHNLIKLNSINRKNKGTVNYSEYFGLEKFTIIISVCVVVIALIAQHEITQLEQVGKWFGLAFVAIGYMAQSIVVSFMGKAESFIEEKSKE